MNLKMNNAIYITIIDRYLFDWHSFDKWPSYYQEHYTDIFITDKQCNRSYYRRALASKHAHNVPSHVVNTCARIQCIIGCTRRVLRNILRKQNFSKRSIQQGFNNVTKNSFIQHINFLY